MVKSIAIVAGSYHKSHIETMVDEARSVALDMGMIIEEVVWVPGSMEMPLQIKRLFLRESIDGAVVLGIQNCGIPEWYQDHVRFSYGKSKSAHTVCIIGYYNDETLGPCFVSKMSNKPTLLSTDAFMKKKLNIGGTSLSPRFFSYGLLPLKTWFCNSNPDGQSFKLQKIDSVLLYPFEDLKSRLQKRKEWLIDNPIEEEEGEKKEIEIRRSSRSRKPKIIIDANHMGVIALKF